MRTVQVTIRGVSPYSASRQHETPKDDKEHDNAYELRTWREKAWTDQHGEVIIPGLQLVNAIQATAKHLGEKIPGKGMKRWTAHFESGLIPLDDLHLGVRKEDLASVTVQCNPQGRRGGGSRVPRTFPIVPKWEASMQIAVLDDLITEEIFERYLLESGRYNGLGRWRPQNRGMNGRFEVVKVVWS